MYVCCKFCELQYILMSVNNRRCGNCSFTLCVHVLYGSAQGYYLSSIHVSEHMFCLCIQIFNSISSLTYRNVVALDKD